MNSSKVEKWLPASNIYDDLHSRDSLPSRNTSTIGYIHPRDIENTKNQRPTISLILPTSSSEKMITLDTILSMDDTKQRLLSIDSIEQENKTLISNKIYNLVSIEKDQSCVCWTIREIIQLICIALFASLIAIFAFTLIFYVFDNYWFEQIILNNSLWWFYDNNYTNFTDFDYYITSTTSMINNNDDY